MLRFAVAPSDNLHDSAVVTLLIKIAAQQQAHHDLEAARPRFTVASAENFLPENTAPGHIVTTVYAVNPLTGERVRDMELAPSLNKHAAKFTLERKFGSKSLHI